MKVKDAFVNIIHYFPSVKSPERVLTVREKLKYTAIVLVMYFALALIPLYGLSPTYKSRFENIAVLLAAQFGSLISLGIGPIVTGSMILQLLVGSKIINIDIATQEGKKLYSGLQKLFNLIFIFLQNGMYVFSGALPPATPTLANYLLLYVQLILGSFALMYLDEISSKYGIGSGISLFIAAGVGRQIVVRLFSPLGNPPVGAIPNLIYQLSQPVPNFYAIITLVTSIIATFAIMLLAIYLQSTKVNVPLTFVMGRVQRINYPISLLYTSNIPIILTVSLISVLQIVGLSLYKSGISTFGTFDANDNPSSGFIAWLQIPSFINLLDGVSFDEALSLLIAPTFLIFFAIIFSIVWVDIGGQDPETIAEMLASYKIAIPGFRQSKLILARYLERYIRPLAVLGGIAVGVVAILADFLNALARGTGILLASMIITNFYNILKKDLEREMLLKGIIK